MPLGRILASIAQVVPNGEKKTIRAWNDEKHGSHIDWSCAASETWTVWPSSYMNRAFRWTFAFGHGHLRLLGLPDEVLLVIFELYLELLSESDKQLDRSHFHADRLRAPFLLCTTCKRVRALVQRTPGFWTYIVVPKLVSLHNNATLNIELFNPYAEQWLALVKMLLDRSGAALLDIRLMGILAPSLAGVSSVLPPEYRAFYKHAFVLLRGHMTRFRTLRIGAGDVEDACSHGIAFLLGNHDNEGVVVLHSLEELNIGPTYPVPQILVNGDQVNERAVLITPRLRQVSIGGSLKPLVIMHRTAPQHQLPLHNLRHLSIEGSYRFSLHIGDILEALGPFLEHLRLSFPATDYVPSTPVSWQDGMPISLASLLILSISAPSSSVPMDLDDLFRKLHMPNLHTLDVFDGSRHTSTFCGWILGYYAPGRPTTLTGVVNLTLAVQGLTIFEQHGRSLMQSVPALRNLVIEQSFLAYSFLPALRKTFEEEQRVQLTLRRMTLLVPPEDMEKAWKLVAVEHHKNAYNWNQLAVIECANMGVRGDPDWRRIHTRELWIAVGNVTVTLQPM